MTLPPIDTVVFDLDGVLYRGEVAVPGVAEVIKGLMDAGRTVLFATNNSTTTEEGIAESIRRRTGLRIDPRTVVTSGVATARALAGTVTAAYVIGGEGLPVVLEREGVAVTRKWQEADVVVVGLDRNISYEKLTDATYAVRAGARLVATNHDPTFPTAQGLAPGAGSLVAALERATGQTAEVMGKPQATFGAVVSALSVGSIAVVGDRIDSDMALARSHGWVAILVLTGVTTETEAETADVDCVLASAAELGAVLV